MAFTAASDRRRRCQDLRTKIAFEARRATREAIRAIGTEIRLQREDAGVSQARLARAAGISPSLLSRIEAELVEPSIHVLAALAAALGGRLRIRVEAGTGSPLRDHIQSRMIESFVRSAHPRWRRFLEVPLNPPIRGVIDAVIHDPTEPTLIAVEAHSEIRRLEAQVRWANEKARALLDTELAGVASAASGQSVTVSTLLLLRSTSATRELSRRFEETLHVAYPARSADIHEAVAHRGTWPGSGILWVDVRADSVRLLSRPPPPGVRLGR
jgi:transcriptional regulator with XRE-family HTH domain